MLLHIVLGSGFDRKILDNVVIGQSLSFCLWETIHFSLCHRLCFEDGLLDKGLWWYIVLKQDTTFYTPSASFDIIYAKTTAKETQGCLSFRI
jgi:hypothetical protein